jgi:hypothetical protein
MCERSFISDELCPEGYTYNNVTKTCTLVDIKPANCNCTADVIASPQQIVSGTSTNIVLTSTVSGIGYNWTVSQSGVTGATSGSGNIISQVLSGAGTATYTITPYEIEGGCQGTPVQVVVTVQETTTTQSYYPYLDIPTFVDGPQGGAATCVYFTEPGGEYVRNSFYANTNNLQIGDAVYRDTQLTDRIIPIFNIYFAYTQGSLNKWIRVDTSGYIDQIGSC